LAKLFWLKLNGIKILCPPARVIPFKERLTGNFTRPPEYLYRIPAIAMML
jgi:hypothetical protein